MLVVTRCPRQTLRIGEDVIVTVLEIRGTQVRIGVQAPRSIPVMRQELLDGRKPPLHRPPGAPR